MKVNIAEHFIFWCQLLSQNIDNVSLLQTIFTNLDVNTLICFHAALPTSITPRYLIRTFSRFKTILLPIIFNFNKRNYQTAIQNCILNVLYNIKTVKNLNFTLTSKNIKMLSIFCPNIEKFVFNGFEDSYEIIKKIYKLKCIQTLELKNYNYNIIPIRVPEKIENLVISFQRSENLALIQLPDLLSIKLSKSNLSRLRFDVFSCSKIHFDNCYLSKFSNNIMQLINIDKIRDLNELILLFSYNRYSIFNFIFQYKLNITDLTINLPRTVNIKEILEKFNFSNFPFVKIIKVHYSQYRQLEIFAPILCKFPAIEIIKIIPTNREYSLKLSEKCEHIFFL